jgi:hypothetical protein
LKTLIKIGKKKRNHKYNIACFEVGLLLFAEKYLLIINN